MSESSSSQSSSGQSSDPEPKDTPIPFNMHRGSINPITGLGTFHLEMPLSEGMSNTKANDYPPIVLDMKDDDQLMSLMRMKQLQHENILALHFFDKDEVGGVRAFFEPYTGYITDLFDDVEFFVNKQSEMVPSKPFQEIVSASLNGLDCIIKNDLYHGNFAWDTTVYHQENDGKRTLKLCNFEDRKNKSLLECQVGDCHALAHSLEKVSKRVQEEYVNFKPDTCCLIDDLARRLRAVNNMESLRTMKQETQDCVFFWDYKRKRTFCAYEMPAVRFRPAFLESFQGSSSAPTMPWNAAWNNHLLMSAMETYRVNNKIDPYNFDNINDFLGYIIGLYTHQIELELKVLSSVDVSVHLVHPCLLLDLKTAVEVEARDVDNQ